MSYAAKGAILAYESSTGPSVFSTIPGVGDFDIPLTGERDELEMTSHDSPNDFEETELGLKRTPAFSVQINKWDGTNTHHAAIVTRANANTATNFKVTMTDGMVATFAGKFKGVSISNPVAGIRSATISVKISGSVTYAAAT